MKKAITTLFCAIFLFTSISTGQAMGPDMLIGLNLPPIEKSTAFKMFLRRPQCERSKVIYLIDRFKESDVTIFYGSNQYRPKEVAAIIRMFLMGSFKSNQTAKDWVQKYASRTRTKGRPILFRTDDGKMHPTSDILLSELEKLDELTVAKK